jgi:DNA invertase Pin-like site-specific DNA recombinase
VLTSKAVYLHSYKARDDHLWDPGDPKRSAQLRCGEWNRLGRSLQHPAQLIGERETHGTALVASSQGIDTSESNPAGRLQMHVLAAVAEFERSVIVKRINAGLAAARERGAKLGRPRTLHRHVSAVAKLSRKGLSGRKIAAELNIPVGSVFGVLKKARNGSVR